MSDNVVNIRSATIKRRRLSERLCLHHDILVDAQAREVECGQCGASLDPVDALNTLATTAITEDSMARAARQLDAEIRWLLSQSGRLVVTPSRAEASAGGMTATSTSIHGGRAQQLASAIESLRWKLENRGPRAVATPAPTNEAAS